MLKIRREKEFELDDIYEVNLKAFIKLMHKLLTIFPILTLLFFLISSLFHETQSLYLVGAFHGTINYMDQVIEIVGVEWTSKPMSVSWSKDIFTLVIILIIYLFIIYHKSNTSIDQSTQQHISIGEEE